MKGRIVESRNCTLCASLVYLKKRSFTFSGSFLLHKDLDMKKRLFTSLFYDKIQR